MNRTDRVMYALSTWTGTIAMMISVVTGFIFGRSDSLDNIFFGGLLMVIWAEVRKANWGKP